MDFYVSLYISDISEEHFDAILGQFIRGKIRHVLFELYHLYEHVISKTKTAGINGSRLISVLTRFHVNVAYSKGNPTWRTFQS